MLEFFWTISITGAAYFLLAKRRFDWFTVAFFSACIYFLPGFFGYTSYVTIAGWNETPIHNTAYGIMILVEIAILSGAIISDSFLLTKKMNEGSFQEKKPENVYVINVLFSLAVIGLMLMFFTTGTALFDTDKQSMMDELNRSHILFYTATMLGCTLSFEYKKWHIFGCFCMLILFDVFIGFRSTLAITSISIFTLWLSKQGKKRLLMSYWKQGLAAAVVVVLLFFLKQIQFAIKYGDVDLLKSVLTNPSTYSAMFMNSEPFICQSTLNEVVTQNYSVGMDHLKGVIYQFILFAPELGLKAKYFNDLFQPDLFPEVDYGMANNIWAEMWSAGGWPLLLIFIIMFIFILKLFSILTASSKKNIWRAFVAVLASYWAFYIHRNDISYEIGLEKRVLLVMGLSFIIAYFLKQLNSVLKISRSNTKRGGHENF